MSNPEKTQAQTNPAPAAPPTPPADQPKPDEKVKKSAAAQPSEPSVTKITVQGPTAGRWRAGRKFSAEPVDIPLADLTDDELAALKGDPALMCTIS